MFSGSSLQPWGLKMSFKMKAETPTTSLNSRSWGLKNITCYDVHDKITRAGICELSTAPRKTRHAIIFQHCFPSAAFTVAPLVVCENAILWVLSTCCESSQTVLVANDTCWFGPLIHHSSIPFPVYMLQNVFFFIVGAWLSALTYQC